MNSVENALHVQVHHLGEHLLRVGIELLAPGGTGIGEEDIDVVGRLGNLGHQAIQLLHASAVGWHGDGLSAWPLVGQSV